MTWTQWFTVACFGVAISTFPFTIHWLRQAATLDRITQKIHNREPLTDREQRMLDRLKL